MKKFFILLTAMILAGFLAACGSGNDADEGAADNTAKQEQTRDGQEGKTGEDTDKDSETGIQASEKEEGSKASEKVPVYQEYDFGPNADASAYDQETLDQIQQLVNELGDPQKDLITFNGFSAVYDQEGNLLISVFVRNGTNQTVYNIQSDIQVKDANGEEIIASGHFGFPEADFGRLSPGKSRVWTLRFTPDHIYNTNYDLQTYVLNANYEYNY